METTKAMERENIKVVIERGNDGTYSCFMDDYDHDFGLVGDGKTVEEAKADFMNAAKEMKEYYKEQGRDFPDVDFNFVYDTASFLNFYAYAFTLAGLGRITGINQGQLSHYVNGVRRPSRKTVQKIQDSLHEFAKEIEKVEFV